MGSTDWVAVALSADVAPETAVPVVFGGRELVLWRSAAGAVRVWTDRCPHRGMRFSFGFVRGETLTCLYHGWRFGPSGACTGIPAHPDLEPPVTICAETFPTTEAGGLVWLWPDRDSDPEGPPPTLDGHTAVRSLTVSVPSPAVTAALGGGPAAGGLVRTSVDGIAVAVAVRPKTTDAATLHVLARTDAVVDLIAVADWCEALRRRVEAGRPLPRHAPETAP